MLKPLLFILAIVTLIALALNFNFFSDDIELKETISTPLKKEILVKISSKTISSSNAINIPVLDNNLSQELTALLNKAQNLLRKNKISEALLVYEKVIEKSKNSNETKILRLFARAYFAKATVHYSYPNFDIDSAIECYEQIVNKFKDSNEKELLLLYMRAKIQQAPFNSKNEIILTYDELLEKFIEDKEQRFEKEIEELLFAKSFALMGIDDEEAIEVLDSIIAKYDDKSKLPDTVKFSILNNIELSIITSNDTDKYVDLANEYMSDSPDTKPLLDMLSIIKNAQDLEQNEAFEAWTKEHKDYKFPDWDFSELRKWVNKMETPNSQVRIRKYLDAFERQKYSAYYQVQTTTPTNTVTTTSNTEYSDSATQNEYTEAYEEISAYEQDPYQNDILSTEPELTYPNPYSSYEPNTQTDGVSHTYENNY